MNLLHRSHSFGALLAVVLATSATTSCAADPDKKADPKKTPADFPKLPEKHEVATVAGGCFWCTEEVLRQQEGVLAVLSGYTGGREETANYRAVCSGRTRHAEAVQVYFDPEKTSFDKILDGFWSSHDPTTLNRQGNDVGPQYRSAIFFHNDTQKRQAEASISKLAASGKYDRPIVTELSKFEIFYPAEQYHQGYYLLNPNEPYLRNVLVPKLKKLGLDYNGKPKATPKPEPKAETNPATEAKDPTDPKS